MTLTPGHVKQLSAGRFVFAVDEWQWQFAVSQGPVVIYSGGSECSKKTKKKCSESVWHPAKWLISGAKSTVIDAINVTWVNLQSDGRKLCGKLPQPTSNDQMQRHEVSHLLIAKWYSMWWVSKSTFNIKYLPRLFIFCAVQHSIAADSSAVSILVWEQVTSSALFAFNRKQNLHIHLYLSSLVADMIIHVLYGGKWNNNLHKEASFSVCKAIQEFKKWITVCFLFKFKSMPSWCNFLSVTSTKTCFQVKMSLTLGANKIQISLF